MFALNFGIIYLFQYLVIVKVTRNDEGFIIYPHIHKYIPNKQPININTIINMASCQVVKEKFYVTFINSL